MRLIDADELIKNIDCSADMGGALGKVVECVKYYAKFMVASAPTIEERKTGKWIETTQGDHYKCSCCGVRSAFWFDEENSSSWEKDMSEWLSDYCPNCGAYMRGEECI